MIAMINLQYCARIVHFALDLSFNGRFVAVAHTNCGIKPYHKTELYMLQLKLDLSLSLARCSFCISRKDDITSLATPWRFDRQEAWSGTKLPCALPSG